MSLRETIADAVAWTGPISEQIVNDVMNAVEGELASAARPDIAALIVAEEQRLQAAIADDPTNPHLQGRLAGLQRARDIATEGGQR